MNTSSMKRISFVLGLLGVVTAVACSSTPDGHPTGLTGTGGAAGVGGAAGAGAAGAGGGQDAGLDAPPSPADAAPDALNLDASVPNDAIAPGPPAQVRLAHLSPDLTAVDFCLAPHGTTTFQGPLLALQANPDGGGGGGLTFGQVGVYLPIDAGSYDLRLVPAGATTCAAATTDGSTAAIPDVTNLAAFASNANATVLLAGDVAPAGADAALTVVALPDDAVLAGGAAALRAVNAVPSLPAADFGLGSFADSWLPLLTDVPFGGASATAGLGVGMVDSRGYLPISALAPQPMSVRPTSAATTDTAGAASVGIDLGSIVTLFAIGGKTGDAAHPPALLVCVDNQPSGGQLSDCSVAQ
jgi:hypothetical protein